MSLMHNDIHGDQMYLRELQSFFFDVLGIMPLTHYGCIGDGRTDNYANLQVAIDDARRRNNHYIYVPFGRYMYRGQLINRENIVFIGNAKAEIINEKTGETIPIIQFGTDNRFMYEEEKVVPTSEDATIISGTNNPLVSISDSSVASYEIVDVTTPEAQYKKIVITPERTGTVFVDVDNCFENGDHKTFKYTFLKLPDPEPTPEPEVPTWEIDNDASALVLVLETNAVSSIDFKHAPGEEITYTSHNPDICRVSGVFNKGFTFCLEAGNTTGMATITAYSDSGLRREIIVFVKE